jgi:hypothetical protein
MIGEGRFQAQLATVEEILRTVDLCDERPPWPNKGLGAAHFKGMTYRQVYEECIREYAFDFRLIDQSLLLFVKSGVDEHDGMLGFSYYDCPLPVVPYREFVGEQNGVSPFDPDFENVVATWGDDLRYDYEQYVMSADTKRTVTPIRYDYKAADYREGIHPASHLHFGFANQIRVGTRRIMNPISFALFVVRQCYPQAWAHLLNLDNGPLWCRNVRDEIDAIHADYWKGRDELEVSLT